MKLASFPHKRVAAFLAAVYVSLRLSQAVLASILFHLTSEKHSSRRQTGGLKGRAKRPKARTRGARRETPAPLHHDFLHSFTVINTGQPHVQPLELVRQLQMVQSEQVQQRRLEIVDMNRILDDVPTDLVGLAEHLPALDPAARKYG